MTAMTIRISEKLKKQLRQYCRQQERSASEVVRDSLRRYLAIQEFQALRSKLVPLAKAQGILTDEDIFRLVS